VLLRPGSYGNVQLDADDAVFADYVVLAVYWRRF
jgi:hypothetical protein